MEAMSSEPLLLWLGMLRPERGRVSPSLHKKLMDEETILDLSALCTELTLNPVPASFLGCCPGAGKRSLPRILREVIVPP